MIPWERYLYIDLLQQFLKEQDDAARQRENENKRMMAQLNKRRM